MISQTQVSGLTAKLETLLNSEIARVNLGLGSLATSSTVSSSQIANGTVSNVHINAAAGIEDTKLAPITSPGKVLGHAITSGTISGTTGLHVAGPTTIANVLKLKRGGYTFAELRLAGPDPSNEVAIKAPSSLGAPLVVSS